MAENTTGASLVDRIFSVGIPALVDLQIAKSYRPNDPTPQIQTAAGTNAPSGQGVGIGSTLQNVPPWVWLAAIGGVVAIGYFALKRR